MWPFSKKDCGCEGTKVSCKLATPQQLRRIQNAHKKKNLEDVLEKITDQLKRAAKYNRNPTTISFHKNYETDILNELAKCGLTVDLSTREDADELAQKRREVFMASGGNGYYYDHYRDDYGHISYKVSF